MNKYKIVFPFLVLIALLLLSCANEDELLEAPVSDYLSFNTHIQEKTLSRVSEQSWHLNDEVGIFMTTEAYVAHTTGINKKYTAGASGTSCTLNPDGDTNKLYYPVDKNTNVRFIAYYPYNSGVSALTTVPVEIKTPQSADNMRGFDLLWYIDKTDAGKFSRGTAQPVLKFTHQMSKIVVSTEFAAEMNAVAATTASLKVSITSIPTKANFNLTAGTYDNWTVPTGVQLNGTTTAQGFIIPHNGTGVGTVFTGRELAFTFTDPMTNATTTLKYSIPDATNFAKNTVYTYKMKLTRKGVEFKTCSINPWGATVTIDDNGNPITLGDRDQ